MKLKTEHHFLSVKAMPQPHSGEGPGIILANPDCTENFLLTGEDI